jgi:phosphatidylglycerol lysyltransferase
VDLGHFGLQGHAMKSLRSGVSRLEREGYRVVHHSAPLPDLTLIGLRAVSDEWLTIAGRRERRFSLGRWDDAYVRASAVMTVEDAAGRVYAFANLIPDGVAGEATIDLMRRRPDAPNAVMDFLFVKLFAHARAAGFARFSLGMTPFAGVGTRPGAPALERGLGLLARHLDRVLAVKGLRAYKDKFGPVWEPRYLVYPSAAALPVVALALVRLTEGGSADRGR